MVLLISLELLLDLGKAILNSKSNVIGNALMPFRLGYFLTITYLLLQLGESLFTFSNLPILYLQLLKRSVKTLSKSAHLFLAFRSISQALSGHCLNLLDILAEFVHFHAKLQDQFLQLESLVIPGLMSAWYSLALRHSTLRSAA